MQERETTLTKGGTAVFPIRGKMGKDVLLGEHFAGQGEASLWQDGLNDMNGDRGEECSPPFRRFRLPPVVF